MNKTYANKMKAMLVSGVAVSYVAGSPDNAVAGNSYYQGVSQDQRRLNDLTEKIETANPGIPHELAVTQAKAGMEVSSKSANQNSYQSNEAVNDPPQQAESKVSPWRTVAAMGMGLSTLSDANNLLSKITTNLDKYLVAQKDQEEPETAQEQDNYEMEG